jgi:DNA primase
VKEYEKLSFMEAVKRVAEDVGVPLPVLTPQALEQAKTYQRSYDVCESAAVWFQQQLQKNTGESVRQYLSKRGVWAETIQKFRIGFAPNGWDGLKNYLTSQGYTEKEQLDAGVLIKNEQKNSCYDRFRARLIFPIFDRQGKVVAFGGRALDESEPKYLNSPETALFHKGATVYGFPFALKAIQQDAPAIVVEGYMDVIALHQAGFQSAVAPLGTALTEEQIQLLWTYTETPILCFDGDTAGQRAANRALERVLPILKPNHSIAFLQLPAKEDPDSLIQNQGKGAFANLLEHPQSLLDKIIATFWPQDGQSPEMKAGALKTLKSLIGTITDSAIKDLYLQEINTRWQAARNAPRQQQRFAYTPAARVPFTASKPSLKVIANKSAENISQRYAQALLAALINHPRVAEEVLEQLGNLPLPQENLDRVRQELLSAFSHNPTCDRPTLLAYLSERLLQKTVDVLLSPAVCGFCPFVRMSTPHAKVLEEWQHLCNSYLQLMEKQEISEALAF